MRIRAKAFLFSILAALIFSSCNNFFHDLIPPSDNEIKSFRLMDRNGNDVTESSEIDGTNINIKVRPDADISSLLPLIEKPEKSSVFPITIEYIHKAAPSANLLSIAIDMQNSRQSGNLASWALDFVQKNPDFNVPPLDRSLDFRASVPIAVIAGTGNTKIYQVNVEHVEFVDDGSGEYKTGNEILSFSVEGQDGDSVISDSAVEFHMPPDSDLRNIVPSVSVSDGATILPLTQDYILKYVGFSDLVSFYGEYSAAKNPEKFFETWIKKNNITLEENLDIPIDFSSSVPFIIKSAVGSVRIYNVTCTCIDDTPRLLSLVFTKFLNEKLVRDSSVEFGASHTQSVEAVYPAEYISDSAGKEDAFHLVPSFVMDADRATFCIGGSADVELVSGETAITFPGAVSSCTIKVWRGTRSVEYTIDMSSTEDPDTIRSITDFRFPKSKNSGIKTTAMASIVDDGDIGTITVTLLYTAGDESSLNSLYPTFITPGTVERDGSTFNSGNGLYNLLQNPSQKLTCISRDGMYKRVYTLKVNFVEIQPAVAAMRSFSFPMSMNPDLSRDAVGIINDSAGTIMVNVPYRTREIPSSLVADFSATGNVFADGIPQSTGSSRGDFRYSKNYKVIAADDSTVTKTYKVQVAWVYEGVCECSLDSMVFRAADNPTLSSDVQVTITQGELRGSAFLPYGTDSWNTPLIPTFEAHGTVTVNGEPQTSGISAHNFSEDIVYTVTSADGITRKDYTIRATETGSVIYMNCNATGRNDGSSWEDAFTTPEAAADAIQSIPDGSSVEVWITDGEYGTKSKYGFSKNQLYIYLDKCHLENTTLTLRGGFDGTENSPAERKQTGSECNLGIHVGDHETGTNSANLKAIILDKISGGYFSIGSRSSKIDEISIINCNVKDRWSGRIFGNDINNINAENSTFTIGDYFYGTTNVRGNINIKNCNIGFDNHLTLHNSGEAHFEKCNFDRVYNLEGDMPLYFEDCNFTGILELNSYDGDIFFTRCKGEKGYLSIDTNEKHPIRFTIKDSEVMFGYRNIENNVVNEIKAENSIFYMPRYIKCMSSATFTGCVFLGGFTFFGENSTFTIVDPSIDRYMDISAQSVFIKNLKSLKHKYWDRYDEDKIERDPETGWPKLDIAEDKGGSVRIYSDNASVMDSNIKSITMDCTKSASVTGCTFFNTEGEKCADIKAPEAVTFTNNKFKYWGICNLATKGLFDFSGFSVENAGGKMRFGLDLGGGTYSLKDWDCEYQFVKTGAGANLTADGCVVYENLESMENSTFELTGCDIRGGIKMGSGSTLSAENCTVAKDITGGSITADNSSVGGKVDGEKITFTKGSVGGNVTGTSSIITSGGTTITGDVCGYKDVSLSGGSVGGEVTAIGNLTLSDSISVGGSVSGCANASFNPGTQISGSVYMYGSGKLTGSNMTIRKALDSKGTVQMTGCNLCSDAGHINTEGSGWATFTSCTINRNIWGDGTTAAGCVIYGTIFDNSPSSVFRSCNLTGENAYVSSRYCGTMQGCEFNGLFYSDRIRYSTGTFDGCWFNAAEGSSLTGITVSCGATVRNMTFYRHGDTAIDVRDGDSSRTTTIENCKFLANSSTERSGAGVLIVTGNALVKNCIFCENYSKYSGGGIAYIVGEPRWCTLQDCLFVNDSCDPAGGKDAWANGPSGSGVNIWNTSCAGTIFDIWGKFSKGGDISAGLPNIVSDFRHAADFL